MEFLLASEKEKFYTFYKTLNPKQKTLIYCFKPGTVLLLSMYLNKFGFATKVDYRRNTVQFGKSGPYSWHKFYFGDQVEKQQHYASR